MTDKELYKCLKDIEKNINDKFEMLNNKMKKYEKNLTKSKQNNEDVVVYDLNEKALSKEEEKRIKTEAYEILKKAGFSAKYKDILFKILTHFDTKSIESVIYDERLDVFKLDEEEQILQDERVRNKVYQIIENEGFDKKYEDILYKLITHPDSENLESIIYDSRLEVFKKDYVQDKQKKKLN
ncbi:hypothetical protein J6W34_03725 [bacterium]|nr:hypothetical protein [bacterium]